MSKYDDLYSIFVLNVLNLCTFSLCVISKNVIQIYVGETYHGSLRNLIKILPVCEEHNDRRRTKRHQHWNVDSKSGFRI